MRSQTACTSWAVAWGFITTSMSAYLLGEPFSVPACYICGKCRKTHILLPQLCHVEIVNFLWSMDVKIHYNY
jgi:hypothetical protein